jgi:hypothetical protein
VTSPADPAGRRPDSGPGRGRRAKPTLFDGSGRSHSWDGDQQYTVAAAVAVKCCSSRSTVDDRSDQHITVVGTAMVCCSPSPSPSAPFHDRGQPPRWHPALFDLAEPP